MKYDDDPEPRHDLPTRRPAENRKVRLQNDQTIHLSIGYDPNEDGRPREVFYAEGFRSGSELEFLIQDACVLISTMLQHGHRPEDIAKSLSRTEGPDRSAIPGSIIGLIAEELSKNYKLG